MSQRGDRAAARKQRPPRWPARADLRRLSQETSGQALVEFAIVTPLIVMMLLFAMWFYEVIQIKLKVQEAARFAAWEPTAYQLHDYKAGPSKLWPLAGEMMLRVPVETMLRYVNLDSANNLTIPSTSIMSASWAPPIVLVTSEPEELIYGGPIVNMIFGLAGSLLDIFSTRGYSSPNPTAQLLIGAGKGAGWAGTARLFGSSSWGFNSNGYTRSIVMLSVTNNWFNRGVQSMVLPNWGVFLTETNGVLADSWALEDGADAGTHTSVGTKGAGALGQGAFAKQVERLYLVNSAARAVMTAKTLQLNTQLTSVMAALKMPFSPPGIAPGMGFSQASLVSLNYGRGAGGKAKIFQDRPTQARYDTAPANGEYEKTLNDRGPNFMGCDRVMALGCPTAGLSQENPFGDYVYYPKSTSGAAGGGLDGYTPRE